MVRHYLPASPPLPLSALLDRRERANSTFPFSAPRGRWYYLGCNALWHGLRSLRLDEGDEVLVPAYNSGAEVDAIIAAGLAPRFFRVGLDLMPDLHDMQQRVSRRTRALLVIHYFGFPQPLADLTALCARNELLLVEDCTPALFSRQGKLPLGSTGVFSVFSPHKTLPLPHGGFLVINYSQIDVPDELEEPPPSYGVELLPRRLLDSVEMQHPEMVGWARRTFRLRTGARSGSNGKGVSAHDERFDPSTGGLSASLAVQRFALRPDPSVVVQERRSNYRMLGSLLPEKDQLLTILPEGACPLFLPFFVSDRPAAIRSLASKGMELFPYCSMPHAAIPAGAFPEAEHLRAHLLALPVYQGLSLDDICCLAGAVRAAQYAMTGGKDQTTSVETGTPLAGGVG